MALMALLICHAKHGTRYGEGGGGGRGQGVMVEFRWVGLCELYMGWLP